MFQLTIRRDWFYNRNSFSKMKPEQWGDLCLP